MPTFTEHGPLIAVSLFDAILSHPSLQFFVPMNEGSGAMLDRCVRNRLSGAVSGSPTRGVALANGFVGMTFVAATPDFIDFGNIAALNFERTDPISGICVYSPIAGTAAQKQLVGKWGTSSTGWVWDNEPGAGHELQLRAGSGQAIRVRTNTALTAGTVYIIGFTYSGSSTAAGVILYTNGIAIADTDITDTLTTSSIQTSNAVRIGATADGTLLQNGTLGFVAIFNAALTAREMLEYAHLGGFA